MKNIETLLYKCIKHKLTSSAMAVFALLTTLSNPASSSLQDLYDEVVSQASNEANYDSEREKRFQASAQMRARMLADVNASIAAEERKKENLKKQFDNNEDTLAELSTILDRRIGDLGELFGVFRQTTDDTQALLFDSLVTLEYPDRREDIDELAGSSEVPTIPQLQDLWRLLMHEINYSGEISKFKSEVVAPQGTTYEAEVTRVGTFNLVTDDKYLGYLSEEIKATELPRQPVGYARASAQDLGSAGIGDEAVTFAIDPSRGALLGLLVQSPSIMERIQQGKTVGYLIILVGLIGLILILERWMRLSRISKRINNQLKDMDHFVDDNPLGQIMGMYYENEYLQDLELISRKLETIVITAVADIKRGLPLIKVFAAVAPLMGLLGTVSGMIETFQAITLFGTGDPKLMAGGISTALITTVLGLCVAIPLLLSHSFLNGRALELSKVIGEQAAGMMAKKAEDIAKSKRSKESS